MHGINHPVNDPTLVSYHRPELVKILPQLEQAYDCWTLLNADGLGVAKLYIPVFEARDIHVISLNPLASGDDLRCD